MDKPDPHRKPARSSSCYSSPVTCRHQGSLVSSSVWSQQEKQGRRPRLRPIPSTAGSSCVLLLPDRRWLCHLRAPWAQGATELRRNGLVREAHGVENHHGRGGAARQTAIVDRVDRTGLVPREQIEGVFFHHLSMINDGPKVKILQK
jgi:hypothetical protein